MGEIIAVLSGKGGTGKTSVCAGLAAALAGQNLRILCVDCDVGLRNLDISLGIPDSGALSFLDVCSGEYALEQATGHPDFPSLRFLTAPMSLPAEGIDPDAFAEMLRQARDSFDYILLDAAAGVDAGFHLVSRNADRHLIVTGAGPAAVRDATRVGELLELMEKPTPRLIVNRVDRSMLTSLRMTIDDVMDTTGLPLIGIVPEDGNVTLAAACAMPLVRFRKRSPAVAAFRRIANRIQGVPEPISLR